MQLAARVRDRATCRARGHATQQTESRTALVVEALTLTLPMWPTPRLPQVFKELARGYSPASSPPLGGSPSSAPSCHERRGEHRVVGPTHRVPNADPQAARHISRDLRPEPRRPVAAGCRHLPQKTPKSAPREVRKGGFTPRIQLKSRAEGPFQVLSKSHDASPYPITHEADYVA